MGLRPLGEIFVKSPDKITAQGANLPEVLWARFLEVIRIMS
jgi:hypothetical protein